ncbi:MAG: response regulator [Desulfomonile sp.]|nr:response regulator [Desulfomonile sp.]
MNVKVLLVDDEKDFTDTLGERLQARGFEVRTASSGDEGLALLKEKAPDVVILDVLMPGKDGVEVLREIKGLNPIVEVIMLTGHGTIETAIEGLKLGAYDYLLKPTDTGELVAKILRAYARKSEQEDRIRRAEIANIVAKRGW